jgi:hypothetical protein
MAARGMGSTWRLVRMEAAAGAHPAIWDVTQIILCDETTTNQIPATQVNVAFAKL